MNIISDPRQAIYQQLAQTVRQHLADDGRVQSVIPNLGFYRHNGPFHSLPCVQPLGLVLAVQGNKELTFGEQKVQYGVGQGLFIGANIAGFSYMPDCSAENPFLGVIIDFELSELINIATELCPDFSDENQDSKVFNVVEMTLPLLTSVAKLVALLQETPRLQEPLAKLARSEIALRLLADNPQLCHSLASGSSVNKIINVMAWLRQHFREKVSMGQLAELAHMSPSSFRQHFSNVTGLSPLQYQKQLRLQEARSLIHNQNCPASSAAIEVGYESASQFSREYRRFFGVPPSKDK